eukprot:TRINITY_DN10305_c0_g1_i2.p1 TRINITY_DN10305_c0_g1~~TRINITY_DN10305_c0_g1_i2.p1  ORF type:complete len:123 (+),score=20.16 TRINITY_DN10305_c0_g1_i2:57-425(+)
MWQLIFTFFLLCAGDSLPGVGKGEDFVLASSTCTALMQTTGWSFAVPRDCNSQSQTTCSDVCAATKDQTTSQTSDKVWGCNNALHIYGEAPGGRAVHGIKVFRYNTCFYSACGPNWCCCTAS